MIKDAALELFRTTGYERSTTKQIALAAGVAEGTIFLVAPTKEGLLVTVLEEKLRELAAPRLASMPRRGIAAQLVHFCEPLFDFFAADPALSRALLKGMMFFSDPVAKARRDAHIADFLGVLGALFEGAKARGELAKGVDAAICAKNVFAIYVDAVTAFVTADGPDRATLGAAFQARIDSLLRGSLNRTRERR